MREKLRVIQGDGAIEAPEISGADALLGYADDLASRDVVLWALGGLTAGGDTVIAFDGPYWALKALVEKLSGMIQTYESEAEAE